MKFKFFKMQVFDSPVKIVSSGIYTLLEIVLRGRGELYPWEIDLRGRGVLYP